MKKSIVVLMTVLLAAACGSSNNMKGKIADPEVRLFQTSVQTAIAEHVTGGIPVDFALSVTNHAEIPITLKRINIQSMGSGGYNVSPTSRPFNVIIAPGATEQVQFTLPTFATASVAGVNGAVAMRVIAQFDTAQGAFENTTVHQVGGRVQG